MSTAALIRNQIEQLDDAINEEETANALNDKSKPTEFGNVQFGARNKAWSFAEIEDLAKSNILYRNFRTHLARFMELNHFKPPKDEDRVCIISNFLISYNNLNLMPFTNLAYRVSIYQIILRVKSNLESTNRPPAMLTGISFSSQI
jgi:hypothetical protein